MTNLTENQVKQIEEFNNEAKEILLKKIPSKYQDIDIEEIKKMGMEYKNYYIFGGVGVGKTRIAFGLLKAIINTYLINITEEVKNGKNVYGFYSRVEFYNFPNLLDIIRNEINTKRDYDDNGYIDWISNYEGMIILDDIGAEKFTEWSIEVLYKIVNQRYERELKTVFISNLSLKELSEKVGDRIISRIVEMCEIKKIEGEDRRIKK